VLIIEDKKMKKNAYIITILTLFISIPMRAMEKSNRLHRAAALGNMAIVTLYKSTYVNNKDRNGYTPLYYACEAGHVDVVQWLLRYKAIVDETCYELAKKNSQWDVMEILEHRNSGLKKKKVKKLY
jgi:hypothetical protein